MSKPYQTGSEITQKVSLNQMYLGPQVQGCILCKAFDHRIFKCPVFSELSVDERYSKAEELAVCFSCLEAGHRPEACTSKNPCRTWQGKHHTLLHKDPQQVGHTKDTGTHKLIQGLLSILQITVKDKNNNWINVRALLDSGSTVNVMTTNMAQILGSEAIPHSGDLHRDSACEYASPLRSCQPRPLLSLHETASHHHWSAPQNDHLWSSFAA